jgi:cbb3-type cytochrome oxidase subunit 3
MRVLAFVSFSGVLVLALVVVAVVLLMWPRRRGG